jgi:hypothetical protein
MTNSTLARTRRLRGWVYQRSMESLSHPELNLLLPCESRQSKRIQTDEQTSSMHICGEAILFPKPISFSSAICQPFNAHRSSIVRRFSPIHF